MTTDQFPGETAKQRARRIPLDYYRQLTGLDAAKWLLTTLASLAAGGYVLWTISGWLIGRPEATRQFSPGPVASAHALWESDCAACHVPGKNLRHDAAGIALISSLAGYPAAAAAHSRTDARCRNCHSGEPHHDSQLASEVLSCAGCHRDHQGRTADLTRVAASVCTACHSDIKAHRRQDAKSVLGNDQSITSFTRDHPPFRSLKTTHPGLLKFNHRLHMLRGQYPTGSTTPGKRLADVPAAYRERLVYPRRLADVSAVEVIQLSCEYCHVADSAAEPAAPGSGASVPASGAYMLPINFERHCAACHLGELAAEVQDAAPAASRQIPHGANPEQIRALLSGLANPPAGLPRLSPAQPLVEIPGRTPGANLAQSTQLDAATRVASAAAFSMSVARCGKCHAFPDRGGELPWAVLPPRLPSVWLRHARFDHAAHRALACFECHDRGRLIASESDQKPPLDDPAPIIDDIQKCQQCHAPKTPSGAAGARHDCAECHRYHGGERPPHGRGDPARGLPVDQRHEAKRWIRP